MAREDVERGRRGGGVLGASLSMSSTSFAIGLAGGSHDQGGKLVGVQREDSSSSHPDLETTLQCDDAETARERDYHPPRLVEGEVGLPPVIKVKATSAASSFALLRFLPSYQNRAE